jgi:hypothetical protein
MDFYLIVKLGHFLGIALGVGGAIASDFLFIRSIKDKKITADELAMLKGLSNIVWGGLVFFLLSGLLFFYVQYGLKGEILYFNSEPFLGKLTIFSILFINAFVFHFVVYPKLEKANTKELFEKSIVKHAWLFSIVGSISIVSWMYVLLLGTFRSITPIYLNYYETIGIYGGLVVIATITSYFVLTRRK